MEKAVKEIAALGDGDNSLLATRKHELAAIARATDVLAGSRNTATWLADAVDRTVQAARDETDASTTASMTAIRIAQTSMAVIAANRSEEGRGGKGVSSTYRYRWSPSH